MKTSTINARVELAIADLNQQPQPNIRATATRHGLVESTLRRRFRGQTLSIEAARSIYHQKLTLAQEEALIRQINQLTYEGMPPTSNIVRKLAEEMLGGPLGKNWVSGFVSRHEGSIKTPILRNVGRRCHKSK